MDELTRLREALGDGHADLVGAVEQAFEQLRAEAARAADLEAQLAEVQADAERAAALQTQLEGLQAASQASEDRAAALAEQVADAAAKYRRLLLASNPDVPARLVQGTTIGEVEESLASARALTEEIRRQIAAEQAALVPNGSGGRSGADLSTLSPLEKIRRGLAER